MKSKPKKRKREAFDIKNLSKSTGYYRRNIENLFEEIHLMLEDAYADVTRETETLPPTYQDIAKVAEKMAEQCNLYAEALQKSHKEIVYAGLSKEEIEGIEKEQRGEEDEDREGEKVEVEIKKIRKMSKKRLEKYVEDNKLKIRGRRGKGITSFREALMEAVIMKHGS